MAVQDPIFLGDGQMAAPEGTLSTNPIEVALSRAVAPGTLVLLSINASGDQAELQLPTVSGGGVTWEPHNPEGAHYRQMSAHSTWWLFRGVASSPSGTTITVSHTDPWLLGVAQVIEVPGAEIASNGSAAVMQSDGSVGASGAGPFVVELDPLSSPDNAFMAFGATMRSGSTVRSFQIAPEVTRVADSSATQDDTRTLQLHSHYALGSSSPISTLGYQLSGGVDASLVVGMEIAAADGDPPDPTTVAIDQTDPQQVEVGSTLQLSATVTNGDGATTWASDDEAVATVDASGLVSGVAVGSAEITATNNGVSDSITVNVEAAPAQAPTVTITSPAGNIAVTEGTTIVATATATDPVDGDLSAEIEWTSSVDGALGTGASIQIVTEGWTEVNRTITATATNAAELDGSASFVLTIGEAPEPPEPETRFDAARFAINAAGGIA